MTEVVVIGAGPAGLHAAEQVCAAGQQVVLVDSATDVGGQFWRHLPQERAGRDERLLHHGWSRFLGLRDALQADPRCRILTGAQVWAIEPSDPSSGRARLRILITLDEPQPQSISLTPDALVLATGAHDRVLPFPGWDLPGVFTAGAAQAFAKSERVAVGERVIVAGAGPFLLPVAQSLTQTGSRVLGVHEASRGRALTAGWLRKPWQLAGSTGKMGELAQYAAHHVRHRVPYHVGSGVIAAHGTSAVEAVTVARLDDQWRPVPGTERTVTVDAVCVGHGFTPRLELAIAAGCELTADRFVRVDAAQGTSTPRVFAAGEITGIGGMRLSAAEGTIAGVAAAGLRPDARMLRRRDRERAFAARLQAAHGIRPGWTDWLEDDTTICRCEEVCYGTLRRATETDGSRSLRSLKLSTRAGLGICQGRMCGRSVEQILGGPELLGPTTTDRRPIATPIRLADLAATPAPFDPRDHSSGKGQP